MRENRHAVSMPIPHQEFVASTSTDSVQPCSEAVKWQLASEVLHSFGGLWLRVSGSSMLPSIWPGDILYISSRDLDRLLLNEIILYARDGRSFVHRIVGSIVDNNGTHWVTRGDAVPQDDPPISSDCVLGRVTAIQRGRKRIHLRARLPLHTRALCGLLRAHDWPTRALLRLHSLRRWSTTLW